MLDKIQKTREYLNYLEEHYNNVQKAFKLVWDNCADMPFIADDFKFFALKDAIEHHDESKLSKEEFVQYRESFFPVNAVEKDASDFDAAWEHHKKANRHHWQNWTWQCDPKYAELPLIENIIDWVAMSFKFGGTAQEYYESHKDEIQLPEWAVKLMYEIFECIYPEKD